MRRFQIAAAALVALVAIPASAHAQAEKPKNGKIAFSAKRGKSRVIYTRESNGTKLTLVPTRGRADQPAVSPRGARLAFTRYGSAGTQIWVEYLDGTGLRQLTAGPRDTMAAWSRFGDQVVFARGSRGRRDLYSIYADGSGERRLSFSRLDDHSPDWSKSGRIAFVRADHVYSMSPGGAARRLTSTRFRDGYPIWSPTGKTLAFVRGKKGKRDLYTLTADGRHKRRLTALPGDETEPSFSPDGSRIAFTHIRGGKKRVYFMKVRGSAIKTLPARRNVRVRRITSSSSASAAPSWQPTGLAPVIGAVGDMVCAPTDARYNNGEGTPGFCRQKLTSDQLLRIDLSAVLVLGDLQYERGQYENFLAAYEPSFGRVKALTRPVPGNHEYGTSGASGYFDYFNGPGNFSGPAGDRDKGYYSYDLGSWHLVAVNSECDHIGGCGPSSPQVRWLEADLAAHPTSCTLVYFHRPHFTSGRNDAEGDMEAIWRSAYAGNADLILNGHEHFYERFAPQTPDGAADPARGIREMIIGNGGRSRHAFVGEAPNSEFRDNSSQGITQFTLKDGGYDWRSVAAPTGRAIDTGSSSCH